MVAKLDGTNGLLQAYDYQVSTTGFSYTFAAGTTVLVMNPAGTLATGTITMPAAPADGMTISFSSTKAITALTVNANTGQSIVGNPTTLLAGGAASFVYRLANTTWFAQVNTTGLGLSSGSPVLNVYASPGTWTKPATVKGISVTVVGGGGAGGTTSPGTPVLRGSGGGGGGTSIKVYPAPSLPGPQPYTVGAAASSSSFGVAPATVISATGGGAGGNSTSGGAGGVGSNGDANIGGGGGMGGNQPGGPGGAGGPSYLGGGGFGAWAAAAGAGRSYGGGGGGASGPTSPAGGAGAAGVVIVEEFY
jgi:hypothetical protein